MFTIPYVGELFAYFGVDVLLWFLVEMRCLEKKVLRHENVNRQLYYLSQYKEKKIMISFICSSIRPEDAERLEKNIRETIGENVSFEFIAHDNREDKFGLCKLYNMCAEKAQFDYLCFLHEDLQFISSDWGKLIINKLSEPDCGVVGFAGSTVKLNAPSGWSVNEKWNRINFTQHYKRKKRSTKREFLNPDNVDFSPVITIDGMALFVNKKVWQEIRFDDVIFTGFHCYDVDFSLAVSRKYTNYVCNTFSIEHFSEGNFTGEWALATDLFYEKWKYRIPAYVATIPIVDEKMLRDSTFKIEYFVLKMKVKSGFAGYNEIWEFVKKYPWSFNSWRLLTKKMKYSLQKK